MFLISYIGDQAVVFNALLKHSHLLIKMVGSEYQCIIRVKTKREQMRKNCPNVRLDITGEPRRIH